jgi:hypothetical protein
VAIARALALTTPILLMDEPFGALDEQTASHGRVGSFEVRRRTARTIVFVTHSLYEAIARCRSPSRSMTARRAGSRTSSTYPCRIPRALDAPEAVDLHSSCGPSCGRSHCARWTASGEKSGSGERWCCWRGSCCGKRWRAIAQHTKSSTWGVVEAARSAGPGTRDSRPATARRSLSGSRWPRIAAA